jgi:N-acetyl-gamma-glutamylphosphate reductase
MTERDIISAGGDKMTTPRQKANNKYNLKAYKRFDARLKPELYQQIEELREQLKLSKPELMKLLVKTYKETTT